MLTVRLALESEARRGHPSLDNFHPGQLDLGPSTLGRHNLVHERGRLEVIALFFEDH